MAVSLKNMEPTYGMTSGGVIASGLIIFGIYGHHSG
eukprot:CAMPEP_0197683894 /NCGR_PEP_ID=MMETSP1338-20131121/98660_1 /TAXON_ID=43686 ORGANISM="Pelagodinium beii, Strain RCC1491" /NCGR_SAMPLE_ID=MMETSP1338 /ASSEMBLY_ACC=CAM_ASM_000754 /LENGTH=35 /DNA_ID= /DNA_START= /DNA_END= /DNA_ORIENTATION=